MTSQEVSNVFRWYFNFSQVGAISQAREENKRSFRLVWIMIYVIGWILTLYQVVRLIHRIQKYEVHTNIAEEIKKELRFPAITFCNNNKVHCKHLSTLISECGLTNCTRKSLYCELLVGTKCRKDNNLCKGDNEDSWNFTTYEQVEPKMVISPFELAYLKLTADEMQKVAHHPQDLFIRCQFDDNARNALCLHLKRKGGTKLFSSRHGVCYSFNLREFFPSSLKDDIKQKESQNLDIFPDNSRDLRQLHPGPYFGLDLMLNLETDFHIGRGNGLYSPKGLTISIHESDTLPDFELDSLWLQPGFQYDIKLSATQLEKLEPPYTSKCRHDYPKDCPYPGKYASSLCSNACVLNIFLGACNCTPTRYINGLPENIYKSKNFCLSNPEQGICFSKLLYHLITTSDAQNETYEDICTP